MTAFDAWFLPPGCAPSATRPAGALRLAGFDEAEAAALIGALREGRRALLERSAADRADALGRAGARFLDRSDPLRREAEARLPDDAGLSAEMSRVVIEGMARDWTAARLRALLDAELGDPRALDAFVPGPQGASVRAIGPALSLHVGSGTVPGVSATALLRALLVGSAALLKPGSGDVVLSVLLARALAEEAPDLARALAVVYWARGDDPPLQRLALSEADAVIAYGGDASVRALRERAPVSTRFVAYHHRVSAAVVGRDALGAAQLDATARDLARAVATFDQRGCVSPHLAFVEAGGERSVSDFAEAVAAALDELARALPARTPEAATASAIHQLRRTAELRAAAGERVRVLGGDASAWTVLLEPPDRLELSCLGRTLRVHPVPDAADVPALLAPWARHLQTVGVAGLGGRLTQLAAALGAAGASRVCPLADVAFPPPWWHHDGQGPLRSLVRWVDLEA